MKAGELSAAVVPAAGSGSRVGGPVNKLLLPLAGEPLLTHTLRAVAAAGLAQVVLVCRPEERAAMEQVAAQAGCPVTVAEGGPTRQASVANGLRAVHDGLEFVAVHDGARPLVPPALFESALDSAAEHGSGVAALPVTDTLKLAADGVVTGSLDRTRVWAMQTPQAFRVTLLREAVQYAAVTGFEATDEAGLVEHLGAPVYLVEGSPRNLKVTRPDDYTVAEALLTGGRGVGSETRIGFGYDVHRLAPGRELWLGGVRLDSELGLLGHSDADALLHAICDALLGAVALGDIGHHFPPTDPAYEGADSADLLRATVAMVNAAGYRVTNIDATVIAERPKLAPHVPAMRRVVAEAVGIEPAQVSIKATTNEQLDDIGAGAGIAAHAVAMVVRT